MAEIKASYEPIIKLQGQYSEVKLRAQFGKGATTIAILASSGFIKASNNSIKASNG